MVIFVVCVGFLVLSVSSLCVSEVLVFSPCLSLSIFLYVSFQFFGISVSLDTYLSVHVSVSLSSVSLFFIFLYDLFLGHVFPIRI